MVIASLFSCNESNEVYKTTLNDPETYQATVKKLTDVIVYDIFSPPIASRIYAYSNMAAYEVMAQCYPDSLFSLTGQVNDFTAPPKPQVNVEPHLAALHAFMIVGKALVFSTEKLQVYHDSLLLKLDNQGIGKSVKESSLAYGEQMAAHLLQWANGDMYKQTRSFPKYQIQHDTFKWKPTPPDYMEGIEPNWKKIRPLILDSANQYIPKPPHQLTMDRDSPFFKELKEVYDVGVNLDSGQTDIAKFWDCNPYVSHHKGHFMFATKKITPGGHWMGITSIAARKSGSNFKETVEVFTRTSIALFDGFISCWDEKWRSLVVRPETLINQFMDENWRPLLQTPPFPEYTSGHSVISRAAAVTLSDFYGDNFKFHDDTEEEFGLPPRDFKSFFEASEEAAISRLYGGIHYRMAIENGVEQGHKVGEYVVAKLTTTK
ncbi:vanadium-dependent haloperoxidase [Marinoscillum sp. MHG1-6]|uniref:vanadium-dependent haloperoxidase n=1 Tax=Marinoscillum sp. MHG1-6 TaxID=2959627 RepID=UPI002157CD42|nr:vanadium-dependent haloperoxidase [Marinoscillum sp. MHG1-6]